MSLRPGLLCMALMAVALPAWGDIYKYYDSDGNLVLSDAVPKNHAERVERVRPSSIMTVPALQGYHREVPAAGENGGQEASTAAKTYSIIVQSPASDATYQHGGDPIPVAVSVTPALREADHLQVLLDGKKVAAPSQLLPAELDRGEHVLVFRVVDGKGKVLAASKSVFYIHQHSVLNKSTRNSGGTSGK